METKNRWKDAADRLVDAWEQSASNMDEGQPPVSEVVAYVMQECEDRD